MTQAGRLPTTRWSLVVLAGSMSEDPTTQQHARQSLEELCEAYWPALYGYLRRRGNSRSDAEDLIQGFFVDLIERNSIGEADQTRGRFRAFLFASLDHFVHNAHRKEQALKRGGGRRVLSLDAGRLERAEKAFAPAEVGDGEGDPAALFDRQWALCLIERTLDELRDEYTQKGKSEWFDCLAPTLTEERISADRRRSIAARLGLSATAFKVAVHRLRLRYRQRLLEAVGHTVQSPEEGGQERDLLFRALQKPGKVF